MAAPASTNGPALARDIKEYCRRHGVTYKSLTSEAGVYTNFELWERGGSPNRNTEAQLRRVISQEPTAMMRAMSDQLNVPKSIREHRDVHPAIQKRERPSTVAIFTRTPRITTGNVPSQAEIESLAVFIHTLLKQEAGDLDQKLKTIGTIASALFRGAA